ncbi:MAG: hypothetical protein QP772_06015 [Actinomycetaceae bacterium UMB1218B]|nr:hypothetical protein [Actinomycetaceae bacterium UMB1218B]MDK8753705.1 hypothetical protein [Actinomycetaceae bacterium UMB8039A]
MACFRGDVTPVETKSLVVSLFHDSSGVIVDGIVENTGKRSVMCEVKYCLDLHKRVNIEFW